MKNSKCKKLSSLLLVSALTAVMILSGCGKQKIDYDFNEGEQSSESAEGDMAARLGIPESYDGNINVGDSGLNSITIKDEDIQIPVSDGMSIVYFEKNEMDAAYKQKVTEAIFDRADGIYRYDTDVQYKSDIEIQMKIYQSLLEDANNSGDTANAGWYQQYLEQLQRDYEDALDKREGPGEWADLNYIGNLGDTQFLLTFAPSENGLSSYFYLGIHPYEGQILYRPYPGASQVYYYISTNEEEAGNQCTWSKEEAVNMAQEFLNDAGITDVVMTEIMDVLWDYTDASYNTIATELDGYMVEFTRSIDGTAPYNAFLHMVDTLESGDSFFFGAGFANETYSIYLDDNGIFSVDCYDMLKQTGETEENVSLLSWEEILEMAETVIPEYYTAHPTSYSSVTFNDVRLTYYLVNGEEDNTYKYIPVWVFAQVEEYDGEYEYYYPIQLVMIDAVTGGLIDLEEKLNSSNPEIFYDYEVDDGMFFQ